MMVEILDSCVQAQKFLCTFPPLEFLLMSLLTRCRTVGVFNQVIAAGCGQHLLAATSANLGIPRITTP